MTIVHTIVIYVINVYYDFISLVKTLEKLTETMTIMRKFNVDSALFNKKSLKLSVGPGVSPSLSYSLFRL